MLIKKKTKIEGVYETLTLECTIAIWVVISWFSILFFNEQSWCLLSSGGTQIWKWRKWAYRRTKGGGIWCKMSLKKGVIRCGLQKWGLFWSGLTKNGCHSVCKNVILAKIWKVYVKIAAKLDIYIYFEMHVKQAKASDLHVKFFKKKVEEKNFIGCDVKKKK